MDRLDKLVAQYSDYSRKDVRKLVKEKRIEVNGVPAFSFDEKIGEEDMVMLDGEPILRKRRILAVLNKPMGFVTSTEDPRDRTVMELVPKEWMKMGVYPVGRLDKDTEGLLIFTNDGALAHCLISPKNGIEKEYYVEHTGSVKKEDIADYITQLRSSEFTGNKLSNASYARNLSSLKSFYRYLNRQEGIQNNPILLFHSVTNKRKLPEYLTFDQMETLLDHFDLTDPIAL